MGTSDCKLKRKRLLTQIFVLVDLGFNGLLVRFVEIVSIGG